MSTQVIITCISMAPGDIEHTVCNSAISMGICVEGYQHSVHVYTYGQFISRKQQKTMNYCEDLRDNNPTGNHQNTDNANIFMYQKLSKIKDKSL